MVIDRIGMAIRPIPGQRLVEIGPGLGGLTIPLVRAAGEPIGGNGRLAEV